tara:strand:- start:11606 stop:12682 length:1077 start_codon:yes stop_codon:yes gene_type:complete
MRSLLRLLLEWGYRLTGRPAFRARYDIARFLSRNKVSHPECQLAFVLPPKIASGWILDAICGEIDRFWDGTSGTTHAYEFPLPIAEAYFFSHYDYFRSALQGGEPRQGKSLVFFTHPKDLGISQEELRFVLNQSRCVVSMCGQSSEWLIKLGVSPQKIEIATIGADPDFFPPHKRSDGAIGLCTAFYDRKKPERILELVKALPERRFILLGRNWEKWERFEELREQKNFKYEERPYSEYPLFYAEIDVFVSVSKLEGGPVPLVEAMMSNVVPVASRTGIGPDIIEHGMNGFLFDVDAPIATIVDLIERAYEIPSDIRKSVEHLTWERFSKQIQTIASLNKSEGNSDSHIRLERELGSK